MTATTAHDYYLQGKELYDRNTREDNDAAVALFKKALELDPNYALAYVGLTLAYNRRRAHNLDVERTWLDDAITAAENAIAIDSNLTEAYRALWETCYPQQRLHKMRQVAFKRVELTPNDTDALDQLGWLLWFTGHADEALPHLEKAIAINPTSHWSYFYIGNASLALELYDQAEWGYGKAVELKNLSSGQIGLICTYLSQGKQDQAIEQNKRFRANHDNDRYFVKAADVELLLGNVKEARSFAEQGASEATAARYFPRGICATTILGCVLWDEDIAEAQRRLDQSAELDRKRLDEGDESSMPRYDLAAVHAIQGNKAEAYRWLQSAMDAGWRTFRLAMRDPLLLNLHNEQNFKQMMAVAKAKVEEARQRVKDV